MAKIKSVDLSAAIKHKEVIFNFKLDMKFETRELNSHWIVKVDIIERDNLPDDKIVSKFSPHFMPTTREFSYNFQVPVAKTKVNTEPGKEEVYAWLTLGALESPQPYKEDTIKTNEIKVDV